MEEKINVKLSLVITGKEKVSMDLEYDNTSLEQARAIEDGLADLVKVLNSKK